MASNTFYITTAIDYSNGPPHLGHAFEKIGADVIARYNRMAQKEVRFLCGVDEHGLKVQQTAGNNGVSPQEWVDNISQEFQAIWKALDISFDDFIRTSEERHKAAVYEMIRRLRVSGDLYRGSYSGRYCVGCEAYKADTELVDGKCPLHPQREVQSVTEENWFFRLSAYKDRLRKLFEENLSFIRPESRRNEVLNLLDNLSDISVSRKGVEWGIKWPGSSDETVYVWIDALTNYISALGFPDRDISDFWPADLHVIGKDITRFHCLYWPAMLMAAELPVPKSVWGHGFVQINGDRFSKSSDSPFSLSSLIHRYGCDALRIYLIREVPWSGDGEISVDRFDAFYESSLANNLGNLVSRVTSMISKYNGGVVPRGEPTEPDASVEELVAAYHIHMQNYSLHEAAGVIFDIASHANGFIVREEPWTLFKTGDSKRLDSVLFSLAKAIATVAVLLRPFMPSKSEEIAHNLGGNELSLYSIDDITGAEAKVTSGVVLFPKIDR